MWDPICQVILGGSAGLLAASYVGYPLCIHAVDRIRSTWYGKVSCQPVDAIDDPPALIPAHTVTVIISVYNAESSVTRRIENIVQSNFPKSHLDVLIVSDGSQDQTVARARAACDGHPYIHVIDFEERQGKAAAVVEAVDRAKGEVLVFSDATTRFEPDAISRLSRHFAKPTVQLVSGRVCYSESIDGAMVQDNSACEGLYWRVENSVRECEARLKILTGVSGAIYAMRRSRFVKPICPTINDDLVFPMLSLLRHKGDVVTDSTAVAVVPSSRDLKTEFRRRARIGQGAPQAVWAVREVFRPRNYRYASAFVMHKVVRWAGPGLMLLALVSNALLATTSLVFVVTLLTQFVFYGLALWGLLGRPPQKIQRLTQLSASFVLMNAAIAAGLINFIRFPKRTTWEPTKRDPTIVFSKHGVSSASDSEDSESRRRKSA